MELSNSTKAIAKSATIRAVVIRADGTVKEDLGTVAYWHRNPFKRVAWRIGQFIKGLCK